MKKILLALYVCIFASAQCTQGQTPDPPCWYTPDWDWTNFDGENWKGYWTNQENDPYMGCPFQNTSNSDIQDVIEAHDFREEQGWVLLYKNFGCTDGPVQAGMPHFFLYNKFTTMIRMFYYVPNEANYSKAKVEIAWDEGSNTSLLTHARKKALPNEEYTMADNAEKTLFLIEDQPAYGAWVMAEQLIHFDHADLLETDAYWIKVIFTNMTESAVFLNGGFEFTTKSAGIKNQNTTPTNEANGLKTFLNESKERIGKLPKVEDIDKFITNIQTIFPQPDLTITTWENGTEQPDANYYYTTDYMEQNPDAIFGDDNMTQYGDPIDPMHAVNTVVKHTKFQETDIYKYMMLGLKNVAPGVSQGISIFLSTWDTFSGKATGSATSAPAMQPTVSCGSITLNGTITTETDGPIVFLQLPGMAHNISEDEPENWSGLPVYDCPLGNLALESMPLIQKKYYYYHSGFDLEAVDFYMDGGGTPDWYESHNRYFLMDSYNFSENVSLSLNAPSGLEIEELWAGFSSEFSGQTSSKFSSSEGDLLESNIISYEYYQDNQVNNHKHINPIRQLISNGTYSITGASSGQPITVATPLIPLDEFKNTTFDTYHGAKVYLKIAAVMRPISDNYEQTPVLWTTTYEIKDNKITAINTLVDATSQLNNSTMLLNQQQGFPLTWEQQQNRNSDLVLSLLPSPSVEQGVMDDGLYNAFNILADDVDINNTVSGVKLTAEHRIKMTKGLKIIAAADKPFKASIERTLPYATGADATLVHVYNTDCNPSQIKSMMVQNENTSISNYDLFGIYANLVNEFLVLRCPQGEQYGGTLQILNSTGQQVNSIETSLAQDKLTIDVGNLSSGVYFLKGLIGDTLFCCKFVKE